MQDLKNYKAERTDNVMMKSLIELLIALSCFSCVNAQEQANYNLDYTITTLSENEYGNNGMLQRVISTATTEFPEFPGEKSIDIEEICHYYNNMDSLVMTKSYDLSSERRLSSEKHYSAGGSWSIMYSGIDNDTLRYWKAQTDSRGNCVEYYEKTKMRDPQDRILVTISNKESIYDAENRVISESVVNNTDGNFDKVIFNYTYKHSGDTAVTVVTSNGAIMNTTKKYAQDSCVVELTKAGASQQYDSTYYYKNRVIRQARFYEDKKYLTVYEYDGKGNEIMLFQRRWSKTK